MPRKVPTTARVIRKRLNTARRPIALNAEQTAVSAVRVGWQLVKLWAGDDADPNKNAPNGEEGK